MYLQVNCLYIKLRCLFILVANGCDVNDLIFAMVYWWWFMVVLNCLV